MKSQVMGKGWRKARKKPIVVEFREVIGEREMIGTREGVLTAIRNRDFIIRGIEGEEYPITKTTFYKTYDMLDEEKIELEHGQGRDD